MDPTPVEQRGSLIPPLQTASPASSDAILDSLLETSTEAIWAVDSRGAITRFNELFHQYCLRAMLRAPTVGMTIHDLAPSTERPGTNAFWADLIQRCLNGQNIAADGHYALDEQNRHFSINASPVRSEGRVVGATFMMRDITRYRRYQQHEYVELAMARIFSESTDPRETLERVLETLCLANGWTLGIAWIGDPTGQWLEPHAWWQEPELETIAPLLEGVRYRKAIGLAGSVWATGRSVWIANIQDETEILRAPFLEGLAVQATAAVPVRDADETFGVFEFFSRDARSADGEVLALLDELGDLVGRFVRTKQYEAERARLQEALERKSAEWTSTFDAIESPIVILEMDGTITRMNLAAQALAGASFGKLIGAPLASAAPGGPWGLVAEAATSVRDSGTSLSTQLQDVEGRHWDIAASRYESVGRDESRIIAVFRDITSIVDMQNSLRRGEQLAAMGELVAGVAHEVRNPLFGISATLDALELILRERTEGEELFEAMRTWVDRLTQLMKNLLEYGKTWSIDLREGNLAEVIRSAVDATSSRAAENNVTVATTFSELPPMLLDSTRLVQVFENLIANAIDFARNGSVELEARHVTAPRSVIECTVRDSGPGFAPGDLQRVFHPFFSRRRGGTGLGLSIVQRIVEEHGGTVLAENHPQGGAIVRLTFPPLPTPPEILT